MSERVGGEGAVEEQGLGLAPGDQQTPPDPMMKRERWSEIECTKNSVRRSGRAQGLFSALLFHLFRHAAVPPIRPEQGRAVRPLRPRGPASRGCTSAFVFFCCHFAD